MSDLRRQTDINFFCDNYNERVTYVRISASDETRKQRGFTPTIGVDDAESECGLDHIANWDMVIENNGNGSDLEDNLDLLIRICRDALYDAL